MALSLAHGRATASLLVLVAAATTTHAAKSQPERHAVRTSTTYISKRYGYQIALSGKYTMIQAPGQWDGSFPFGDSGQVDLIIDDTQDRKFIVAAKPVPPGMSLSRWEAFVRNVKRQNCNRLRGFRALSLGGVPAREFVNSCPGYEVITLAALHQGRGYLLEYLSPTGSNTASGRRIYEAGRRTFQFTQK